MYTRCMRMVWHARLLALLVVMVLLGSTSIQGGVVFFCHMDGEVHLSACCKRADADKRAHVETNQGSCCEVGEIGQFDTRGVMPRLTIADAQPAQLHVTSADRIVVDVLDVAGVPRSSVIRGPPPLGQSIFSRHCSYLM